MAGNGNEAESSRVAEREDEEDEEENFLDPDWLLSVACRRRSGLMWKCLLSAELEES